MNSKFSKNKNIKLRVFEIIKAHIEKHLPKESKVLGGIYLKPKPKSARLDIIEINTPGLINRKASGDLGLLNINYQHDDLDVVEARHQVLKDIMGDAIVEEYLFKPMGNQIFKTSKYLWLSNTMYSITKLELKMEEKKTIEAADRREIGIRFKDFRKSHNILQTDLENGIPTTAVQISRIENGHRFPSTEILIYMAKYYNMDINYILTGQSVAKAK